MEALERIRGMEERLNQTNEVIKSLTEALDKTDDCREDMIALFCYYGSEDWYEDRERELPEGMPAGVLSEDLVYDAISELREEAIRMLEIATDILKNRI